MERYTIDGNDDHYPLQVPEIEKLLERAKVASLALERIEKNQSTTTPEYYVRNSIGIRLTQGIPHYKEKYDQPGSIDSVSLVEGLFAFFVNNPDLPIKELAVLFAAIINGSSTK